MTAGRGIVHSEMPAGEGPNTGLQLWINLSRKDKMYVLLLFIHSTKFMVSIIIVSFFDVVATPFLLIL